ncbi:hypothetical protein HRI_003865200 [Hibiscus trionum]|uniref:Integrase catalytic domain-containing protein n=1 Tax=Hibiscus trionum TaxID=183268 RepID=A0A9W7MJF2_HIBTR|nr:hypothetical protein HRI_003865200 [Hibiscus trionum]
MARLQGTTLCMSSAYHPQTDGQTEALNRCLEMYLRCLVGEDPSKWESHMAWAKYRYNTAYQSSASMTPFKALDGRDPPVLIDYLDCGSKNDHVDQALQERDELLRVLKMNLGSAQARMKFIVDRHHREVEFAVGDWVFVKLQPYRPLSLRLRRHQKLSPRFFGPYMIEQRIGAVAYRLKLKDATCIHPVFHVSQLKPCRGQPLQQVTPLPLLMEETPGQTVDENLEDKVVSDGEGVVMDEPDVYQETQDAGKDHVMGEETTLSHACREEKEPMEEEHVAPRRSTQVRRHPANLTDFVLS